MPSFSLRKPKLSAVGFIGALALIAILLPATGYAGTSSPKLSAGYEHFHAIIGSRVYAMGENKYGNGNAQLGLDLGVSAEKDAFIEIRHLRDLINAHVIAVAAGYDHTIILTSGGEVEVAGSNNSGQLGLGNGRISSYGFSRVMDLSGKNIIAIAAGSSHSLALSKDGKVYGAGSNHDGELGLGVIKKEPDIDQILAGIDLRIRKDGDIVYQTSKILDEVEAAVNKSIEPSLFREAVSLSGKQIIAIAAGGSCSLALDKDGRVYATGDNKYGQLGLGDSGKGTNRIAFTEVASLKGKNIIAIAASGARSFAIAKDGKVYGAGHNGGGQLGLGDKDNRNIFTEITDLSDKRIIAIAAGGDHTLALAKNGIVYAAGYNGNGQLGLGDRGEDNSRYSFVEITSLSDANIIAIAANYDRSLALSSDGKIYATGYDEYAKLGSNDKNDRNRFIMVPISLQK